MDRGRGRGRLHHSDDRHHDQEMNEVVGREDAGPQHVGALRRLGAEVPQRDHADDEQPEEPLVHRAILGRAHARGVEPGREAQENDRGEHGDYAQQLVGDRAQNCVVGQEVPLRHDVRRRGERIGLDIVVGVAQVVGKVEDEPGEQQHEHGEGERVLHDCMRRHRHAVGGRLDLEAGRVVLADHVQGPDVQHDGAHDHEGQQVVQAEEARQGRARHREAAPQPLHDASAETRDDRVQRGEQIGDDRHRPEAHLPPGKRVAHEGGGHHQQEDDDADDPQHLARRLVGAIVQATANVDVDGEEEHGGADRVDIADQPAEVDVAADVLDAVEGVGGGRRIMHRQHDASQDLHSEAEGQQRARSPQVVDVARRREVDELRMHHAHHGQPGVEPFFEAGRRLVRRIRGWPSWETSADLDFAVGDEVVGRHLEVARCRSLTNAARGVVVRAVAGAEPSTEVAPGIADRLALGDAAQMRANADQHDPVLIAPSWCG